ncbi:Ribonuclease HII (EC [Olavius algarvensis associated proteobacterium Delta 3]|nr:Ribonuclease HII (EC [Olavius algarvensis associated proteobacterium Delta 3]
MAEDFWIFERDAHARGVRYVAGIDEAGRGPLAGPVVAAAVLLPASFPVLGVADSKTLTPKKRDRLYDEIYRHAVSVGIGVVDAVEIDRINILQAALLAMAFSVENLRPRPDCLLIDGNTPIPTELPQHVIPKGDSRSVSIAAASIVAKVTRDRLMALYDEEYPLYGFGRHKGYPTKDHKAAIRKHGWCPIHRKTFRGVREFVSE